MSYYYSYSYNLSDFMSVPVMIVWIVILILSIMANCMIFQKAGQPGWKAIIPFYNSYIYAKIATDAGWMFLLQFIPCIGFIFSFYLNYRLAVRFGHGIGYMFGLSFLYPIFAMILGFGRSTYNQYA